MLEKTIYVDGFKFVLGQNDYYFGRIRGRRLPLHRYVWIKHNGEIHEGMHIHHIDCNKTNNDISNLRMMTPSDHHSLHSKMNSDICTDNLIKYAVPASKEWHASKEGSEWHKQHGFEVAAKTFAEKETTLICQNCGKEFQAYNVCSNRNKFCSNRCKSAWRRKSGVDNVVRICEYCGKEFTVNKYSKSKFCSKSCGQKWSWTKKDRKRRWPKKEENV